MPSISTGQKIKRNPATGGTATSITSQYEFSISSPMGELIGTEYEEYNPFENEISYELYEDVENRRLEGLAAGILTALAIGALVGVVVFTGGAALAVALGIGAVVAGVGSLASAATYMQDKENSRASDVGTYINNAGTASLITTAIIGMLFGAPIAAKGLTYEITQGAPLVGLFGRTFTYEQIAVYSKWGVNGLFTANGFFQLAELGMFFAGEKGLGEETGNRLYDDLKILVEGYSSDVMALGMSHMSRGRQDYETGDNTKPPKNMPPVEDIEVGKSGSNTRPTWRQSEHDAAKDFPDYAEQRSFLAGEEVKYGTKGSVRPDLYKTGSSIDIKNYNIENASGRNNLVRNIAKQYQQRIGNLPPDTGQTVLIDIRGQNVSNDNLTSLYNSIMQKTNNGITVRFKMN